MRDGAKRRWTAEWLPRRGERSESNLHVRFDEGEWQEGLASQAPPVTLYSTGSKTAQGLGDYGMHGMHGKQGRRVTELLGKLKRPRNNGCRRRSTGRAEEPNRPVFLLLVLFLRLFPRRENQR